MANASTILRMLVLTILVVSLAVTTTEAVDCKKFVFAPKCRGISAKRAQMAPLQYRNFQFASRQSNPGMRSDDSQEGDLADYDVPQSLKDEYLRTLLRKYINRQAQALDDTEV